MGHRRNRARNRARYKPRTLEARQANKPLAGGFYATLWTIAGALDCYGSVLGLPRSLASGPCALCTCTKYGDKSWMNFGPAAGWQGSCWTPTTWKGCGARSQCVLFDTPNLSAVNVAMHWLHKKYLGADQYSYASVFVLAD